MANTRYPRVLLRTLADDADLYPVLAVVGARQTGKSTLCRQFAEERGLALRTLDDRATLEQARVDPEGLLDEAGPGGLFIDEAQRVPELFLAIKSIVDRDRRPGRYLLSGSNQPRVSGALAESLLGRAAYRTLRPLTLSELRLSEVHRGWDFLLGAGETAVLAELERRAEESGALDWRQVVRTGGFPRVVTATSPEERSRLLDDYVQVFASRDIREVLGVETGERFEGFLRVTAAWTGQELNVSGLARDLAIPVSTVRRWVDALQRSYLVQLVPPYSRNPSQRIIKAPKLFSVDPAFALAAAREREPSGFHLETLVAIDLGVWKDAAPGRALYHWRLAGGQEVDFVLENTGRLLPVEVKTSAGASSADARHLAKFLELHANAERAILLSCDPEIRMLRPRIVAAPWWAVI